MVTIRKGTPDDFPTLIRFFDDAVAWLSKRGSEGQWGTEPWSGIPKRVERVREMASSPGLFLAEVDGEPVGALIVAPQPSEMVPKVEEPELFIRLLLTSREYAGKDVGAQLIRYALAEAARREVELVRVDCWAGGAGDLVRYYEKQGFKATVRFDHEGWIGQVLEQRLP